MRAIGVFCGSSAGVDPACTHAAWQLGGLLAQQGITLVYGGAQVGLMGSIADAVLAAGGRAIGVIPRLLMDKELGHHGLTELRVVETMAERKEVMMALSDAFIALPGGIGTLDELFEVWTSTQLGLQAKPCGLLNVQGYFDQLLGFLDHAVAQGFLREQHRRQLRQHDSPEALLLELRAGLMAYQGH
jgi:uncharacterized protein (TIGR00730 family)